MGVSDEAVVRFEPSGREARVPRGTTIREAARAAGLTIHAPCGGKGTCGKCAVRIVEGVPGSVRPTVRPARLPRGMCLSCITEVAGALTVRPLNVVSRPRGEH
ncbi:MAG: 2Fe-2S iron-sulfur cluster-binding protein [Coriobacteriia bacterium]